MTDKQDFELFKTAEQYRKNGDYPLAVEFYTKAIDVNPDNPNYYVQRAQIRFNMINNSDLPLSDYQLVLDDCNKAISLDSKNYSAFYLKAVVEYESGKDDEALLDFNSSINLKPSFFSYNSRAALFLRIGKYEQAFDDYDLAIKLCANSLQAATIYSNKASAYQSISDYQNAVKCYSMAISLNPNVPSYYVQRAKIFAYFISVGTDIDYSLVINDFYKAIELEPLNFIYYYYLAEFKEDIKDFNGAVEDIKKAISLNPNNYSLYNMLATLLVHMHNYNEAFDVFDKALSLAPNDAVGFIYFNKANAKKEAGFKEEAKALFLKAKNLIPEQNHQSMNLDSLISDC